MNGANTLQRAAEGLSTAQVPEALMARYVLSEQHARSVFHPLAHLVRRTTGSSMAMVTLLDENAQRQHFWGVSGMAGDCADREGTEIDGSLCRHACAVQGPVVLDNVPAQDRLFCGVAKRLGFRAYLGVPFTAPDLGFVGAVAAVSAYPRPWLASQLLAVLQVAQCVTDHFDLHALAVGDVQSTLRSEPSPWRDM